MKRTNLVAIDISDASVKVLQLEADGSVEAYATQQLTPGIIENGRIVDHDGFSEALRQVLASTKPKKLPSDLDSLRAVICLPETKLFTCAVEIPASVRRSDLLNFVGDEAAKIIPFELDDLYWDFHATQKDGKTIAVFVAAPKTDLDLYVKGFHDAGIRPSFVGSEMFCLGRALLPDTFDDARMIIDIGANTTSIGIFVRDALARFSVVIPHGGSYFSQQIADRLGIPLEEAESLKRSQGLHIDDGKGGKAIMHDLVRPLAQEIASAKEYAQRVYGCAISEVLAAGGSSLIPGLCEFLSSETGLSVSIADPLIKIKGHDAFEENTPRILFSTVIGLALLSDRRDLPRINLLTQYRFEEGEIEKERLMISEVRSLSDLHYVVYQQRIKMVSYGQRVLAFLPVFKKLDLKLFLTVLLFTISLGVLAWVMMVYI